MRIKGYNIPNPDKSFGLGSWDLELFTRKYLAYVNQVI